MQDMTELAQRELALGDGDPTEVDEVAAELSLDNLVGLMAEPPGPLKRRARGRSPSGPVDTGAGPEPRS